MLQVILLLQTGLVVLAVVLLGNQKKILKELTKPKPKRKPQRRQRPRRHVPTSTEYMQQQYKRVAEQYANK